MKIYRVTVHLYEGHPVDLGTYMTQAKAEAVVADEREEWAGPNVEDIRITEVEVR